MVAATNTRKYSCMKSLMINSNLGKGDFSTPPKTFLKLGKIKVIIKIVAKKRKIKIPSEKETNLSCFFISSSL